MHDIVCCKRLQHALYTLKYFLQFVYYSFFVFFEVSIITNAARCFGTAFARAFETSATVAVQKVVKKSPSRAALLYVPQIMLSSTRKLLRGEEGGPVKPTVVCFASSCNSAAASFAAINSKSRHTQI